MTRHYVPRHQPLAYTNGVQLSYVEVDVETGFVKLLGHWVAEDCGRIINPMLVDEQVRGGVAHGIGDALFEHCVYDEQGQLLTTTMMDYLVPMAAEMPDIGVAHVETPTAYSEGGFKGAGEGGVAGAPGAVLNAVNDALSPFGARHARAHDARGDPPRARQALSPLPSGRGQGEASGLRASCLTLATLTPAPAPR